MRFNGFERIKEFGERLVVRKIGILEKSVMRFKCFQITDCYFRIPEKKQTKSD